jgi:hypothetical protein
MNLNRLEDYANYYAKQLILQYIRMPKASETVKALARAMFINFEDMGKWRFLEKASCKALLAIAELFGVYGYYVGVDYVNKKWFATPWATSLEVRLPNPHPQEGFQDYDNPKAGFFLRYTDVLTHEVIANLSATEIASIIRMRALYFAGRLNSKDIQEVLDEYYPSRYIRDKFGHYISRYNGVWISELYGEDIGPTIVYHIPHAYKAVFNLIMAKNFLLRPAGVSVIVKPIDDIDSSWIPPEYPGEPPEESEVAGVLLTESGHALETESGYILTKEADNGNGG